MKSNVFFNIPTYNAIPFVTEEFQFMRFRFKFRA